MIVECKIVDPTMNANNGFQKYVKLTFISHVYYNLPFIRRIGDVLHINGFKSYLEPDGEMGLIFNVDDSPKWNLYTGSNY